MKNLKSILTAIALIQTVTINGFYLPGLAPINYLEGDKVDLQVNSIVPAVTDKNKVKVIIPYDYYHKNFYFCKPKTGIPEQEHESIGSVLLGDRIYKSGFELFMLKDEKCKLLCQASVPKSGAKFINDRIKNGYKMSWLVDGLEAAMTAVVDGKKRVVDLGFPIGSVSEAKQVQLHNHYDIEIDYHETNKKSYRVVGVSVYPSSKNTKLDGETVDCGSTETMVLDEASENTVVYTYSIKWKSSSVTWATRWDSYLSIRNPQIHWIGLVSSVVMVILLTLMVWLVFIRTLRKDISQYNQNSNDFMAEDFGWKLVHTDVFRPPRRIGLLSVLVGSGYQLLYMVFATLTFAVLGFLSPSNRGSLANTVIGLYMLFGFASGFSSARLYKSYGGNKRRKVIMWTIFFVPLITFSAILVFNSILLLRDSSAAVPISTLFKMVAIWFVVNTPLSLLGSYYGYRKRKLEPPVRTNQIPRQVPDKPWYLSPVIMTFIGGVIPFCAIFVELYYIMNSVWFHRIYYMFGFLFLVFIILVITSAEITILMVYFTLCAEDYNWWWLSFITGGSSAFYVLLYGIIFYFNHLNLTYLSGIVLYFGWVFITAFLFFIFTGSIGFVASHYFVYKIYGSIKID